MSTVRTRFKRSSPSRRPSGAAAAPPSGSRPATLVHLIEDMMSHIHRRSADDTLAIMNEASLTMPQMVALHLLVKLDALSVSAIAACLKLSRAATSHLVDRLVAAGLVARSEDPIDRRHKCVAITETGRELIVRIQANRARELTRVLAGLTPAVQAQFAGVLERVLDELRLLPDRVEVQEIVGKELKRRREVAS